MTNKYKDQLKEVLNEKKALDTPEPSPKLTKKTKNNPPSKQRITIIGTIIACILIAVASHFSSNIDPDKPYGKITSPAYGTTTGQEVIISAMTRNLQPGQHVWIVVDKPEISLCWPKLQVQSNTKFKTSIQETGPKEPFTVSLYYVPKTINEQWEEWLDQKRVGGLPMLPDNRRLYSVRLVLGDYN